MFARTSSNKVCARCLTRRYLTTASSPSPNNLPPPPPPSGFAKLTNRRLLAINGHDATHFLQGITTQNIHPGQRTGFYSAFLNAQGRVLHDVFIYPTSHSKPYTSTLPSSQSSSQEPDPGYLIEVDAAEASRLLAHIKKYKLRAKLTARLVDSGEWEAWSTWSAAEKWTAHSSSSTPSSSENNSTIGCADARAPGMGRRLIFPGSKTPSDPDLSSHDDNALDETTLDAYTIRRLLHGVPEGQSEILRETALPQESNIDYMGGIDFRKGCYVGQELTIRTHHTGVVRKRILPVQIYPAAANEESQPPDKLEYDPDAEVVLPPPGTNISRVGARGRSAGKWVSGVGNVGLALCRLEVMTDVVVTGEGSQWNAGQEFKIAWDAGEGRVEGGEVRVKAFVPSWHRNRVGARDLHRERNA